MVRKDKLDDGKIEALIRLLRAAAAAHPDLAEEIGAEINYFETNKERMRYPAFREQGLFVGSGVIEAGCKTVLGRLKRSGMFWTVRGANTIIALRCCELSGRFEDYWESRRALAYYSAAGLPPGYSTVISEKFRVVAGVVGPAPCT